MGDTLRVKTRNGKEIECWFASGRKADFVVQSRGACKDFGERKGHVKQANTLIIEREAISGSRKKEKQHEEPYQNSELPYAMSK